jgi:hypothetical protein
MLTKLLPRIQRFPALLTLSILAALAAISPSGAVLAQNSLTLTAVNTVGNESVIPDLTWSTLPTAASCAATGPGWTGSKAPMGHEVLPAITTNATFTLTCTWPQDSQATLSWINPTKNTDNSNYTNPQDTIIKYRANSTVGLDNSAPPCTAPVVCVIVTPSATSRVITGFTTAQTVNFVAMARNTVGVISDPTMAVSKVFTGSGASDVKSISITVNAKPGVITGLGVQ